MNQEELMFPTNYYGLPAEYSNRERSRFVIIPVPYDYTASYMPGSRFAPRAVLEASTQIELFDEEIGLESYEMGIHTAPAVEPLAGDFSVMLEKIQMACLPYIEEKKIVILLGGEHTVALGLVSSLHQHYKRASKGAAFGVLHFDAHADLRDTFQSTGYSHACVARRIVDMKIPMVQVGIRSISKSEHEFVAQTKYVEQISMWRINTESTEKIISTILSVLPQRVYLSIDVDVFDPSIMPSTGTCEPGGLLWYPFLRILRAVVLSREIVGCDVTELSPRPGFVSPDILVARLMYKIIGYIAYSKK